MIEQDNDFNHNSFTNLDCNTNIRKPILNEEFVNKQHLYNEVRKKTLLRFNQNLQKKLKVTLGNTVYILRKYNKK